MIEDSRRNRIQHGPLVPPAGIPLETDTPSTAGRPNDPFGGETMSNL